MVKPTRTGQLLQAPIEPAGRAQRRLSLSLALTLALALMAGASRPAAAEPLNRIVLRVNDQIATLYDYQRRHAETVREIMQPRPGRQRAPQRHSARRRENVFRDMFQELLLSSRADQLAIEVTDQEVDQAVANMRQSFGIKTDEEFQAALRQSDMTLEQLRTQTRRNLRIREVMAKEVSAKIKVKDEDLRRYYRMHQEQFRRRRAGAVARGGGARGQRGCRRPSAPASPRRSARPSPPARAWPTRPPPTPPRGRPAASSSSAGCRRKISIPSSKRQPGSCRATASPSRCRRVAACTCCSWSTAIPSTCGPSARCRRRSSSRSRSASSAKRAPSS